VQVVANLVTSATAGSVYEVVSDLGTYPRWLEIVSAARPVPGRDATWDVDLRAQLGPFRRLKRLRMRRTVADVPGHVRFERHEEDGRSHSAWTMDARIAPAATGSGDEVELEVTLNYSGTLWVPMLDRVLSEEIRRSRGRLAALVAGQAD
jgi:hypothetical protein